MKIIRPKLGFLFPKRRPGRRERRIARLTSDPLRLQSIGFLHIPKTGGSGVSVFGRKAVSLGQAFPIILSHEWTAMEAFSHFPTMRLAFIVRDPLERIVSGFNSRMRMGRPRNNSPWTVGEAVSFQFFDSAAAMLEGLDSPDERIKSAARFALANISHIKHGYEYYFGSVEFVEQNADRFAIVREIGQLKEFLEKLGALVGLPPGLVEKHYRITHVAPRPTSGIVAGLSPEAAAAARRHLSREYEIFHALLKLTQR
jgi:hypothetical protein